MPFRLTLLGAIVYAIASALFRGELLVALRLLLLGVAVVRGR